MGTSSDVRRLGKDFQTVAENRATHATGHFQEHGRPLLLKHAVGQCDVTRNLGVIYMGIEGLRRRQERRAKQPYDDLRCHALDDARDPFRR